MPILLERDVDVLVRARVVAKPKKFRNLGYGGFIVMLSGGVALFTGHTYYIFLLGAGLLMIGIATVLNNRTMNKQYAEYKEQYKVKGELPPWPDDEKT